jgi:hypothetical protein
MTTTKRTRRAIEKDPLSLIVDLMKQQGEAAGREAFFQLVAESNNPDMAEQAHQLVEWAGEIFRGERKYDPTLRGVIASPAERKQ